jgi:8-amino-7-oxononanoate synthase
LSSHPALIERANSFTSRFGTGASASRLISGSLLIHHELEEKIAELYNSEACLLFGSGFQANATVLPSLAQRGDVVLADKNIHNSIIQGGMLSRAAFRRFRHNDCNHLEKLLKKHCMDAGNDCWVVTESLFSMDGDPAPLDDIIELCEKYRAYLMVDDAHAFGVWGKSGLGFTAGRPEIDLRLGTFGKAGGGYGAFLTCSGKVKEYLVNYCTGFIYSTAPSPGNVGAADAAFDLIPRMDEARLMLKKKISFLIDGLNELGFDTGKSRSQIIPVLLDSESEALAISKRLYESEIFVQAIRPPAVDRSRLRLTLSALHSKEDIERLLTELKNAR